MDTKTSTLVLKTTINEIKNTCPGISEIFVLDDANQVIAQDQNTTKELIDCTTNSLTVLTTKASIVGGIDSLTCTGTDRKINITRYENNYLVTVASKETDEKELITLGRVMVPSMLKLAQEVAISKKDTTTPIGTIAKIKTPTPPISKPLTKEPPALEFIVENLSGINLISGSPETIQIDRALLGQWKELYGDKKIVNATVEEINTKKRVRCKFQPIKKSKFEGQNIVLISGKIQDMLGIKKGALVRIRPVLENGENGHD